MSDAKWGKTWYQAATEITRNGQTWHFTKSAQEIAELKQAGEYAQYLKSLKSKGIQYRTIWNNRNWEYELFTRPQVS